MRIGVLQICSELNPEDNLIKIRKYLQEAKDKGVFAVFFPETFYSMGDGVTRTPYLVQKNNEHFIKIKNLAVDYGMYILGGSATTLDMGLTYNRAYNFTPAGELLGTYDKVHLFSCDLESAPGVKKVQNEHFIYASGNTPKMIQAGPLKIGLSICFDLRFPEMYRHYALNGANLLTVSSAFTVPSGRAHWHTLIRARAIENQCFVVAANQWGAHNDNLQSYGHSLVVDPWGDILCDATEGEKLLVVDLNLDKINSVRKAIKVFE